MFQSRGQILSVAIHGFLIALLFLTAANRGIRERLRPTSGRPMFIVPYLRPGHGGGGGDRSPLPASKGRLPRIAPRQFTPPLAVVLNQEPKLVMEPTLVIDPDLNLPRIELSVLGDPYGRNGPPSNGTGKGGGIGDGDGPGLGPGKGGNIGGGLRLHSALGEISAPVLLFKVEPEFSEEARKAKLQGIVMLDGEVDTDGKMRNIRVTRSLGLGLDDKAIEAVRQWRFRPGYRDGRPVVAAAAIEVNFHLL